VSGQGESQLGWLGIGRMGIEMVRRLLAAGCEVSVYNRTRAKAEPLAVHGARVVSSAADLAGAEVVFVTVGTSDDLTSALFGPAGLMSGPVAPSVVVDCSTISVEASRQGPGAPRCWPRRSWAIPG
jgi:3-hydroxyisobutyrate dehydrogenase